MSDIKINEDVIKRLKRLIIIKENENLKTRNKNDTQMVTWIKKEIEEAVDATGKDKA